MPLLISNLILLFLLGLAFGSFLSVLIIRLKKKQPGIILGHSSCPACHHRLRVIDLIPLISSLLQKGQCRYCQHKISSFYPLVELATGLIFFSIGYKFLVLEQLTTSYPLFLFLFYSLVLIVTFFYDFLYLEIPDEVLLPGILIAFLASFLPTPFTPEPLNALLGALIPTLFFLAQILISKGKWLGGGDLRIGAFMGLILGWKMVLVALILSYLIGSILSLSLIGFKKIKFKDQIAFGPFLVLGTFGTIFLGPELLYWYLHLIALYP